MSSSWSYDSFPLKRADANTQGDDYQYVIQSLDAAIRHAFGFPTGVQLTPAFSISEDGDVEVLVGLSIGSTVLIDEIVDEISTTPSTDDDGRLANVEAIRTFMADYVDTYLAATDLFVEKAGSTMTGALVADGGITGTTSLSLTNVVFASAPSLGTFALQGGGFDLIQYQTSSGVIVGDSSQATRFLGSGTRPLYNGGNIALVSDLVDAAGMVLAYVPKIGGEFTGMVEFANGLRTSSGVDYEMEYNSGANSFSALAVGTDADGDVVMDSGNGVHQFTGDIQVTEHVQLDGGSGFVDILGYASAQVQVGNATLALNVLGNAARPLYNGAALALYTDAGGNYSAGAGITISALGGGAEEISLSTNGITATNMPVGNNGEYSRLGPTGTLVWDSLDIVGGTGIAVNEDAGTKQITVSIDNLGVDTAQLAADAVTAAKLADDAVVFANIDASAPAGGFVAGSTYTLSSTDSVLAWQRGGDLLGTVELITGSKNVTESGHAYPTPVSIKSGSNGPYIIENIGYTARRDGPVYTVTVYIYVDGTLISTGSLSDVGDYINYPLLCKETFDIKAHNGFGATAPNEGGTVGWTISRMN